MKLSPKKRKAVYAIANAAVGVLIVWRLIDGEQSAALLLLVNAVLGLAQVNVPSETPENGS